MYEIDKNIPMETGCRSKYPFPQMEVGDSFFIDVDQVRTIRSSASNFSRSLGMTFAIRRWKDGYRCWRTA